MGDEIFKKQLKKIVSSQVFTNLNCIGPKNLAAFQSAVSFLVLANIPFEVIFLRGTQARAANIELEIFITPTTSIIRKFQLEEGSN